jgi:hypothetical protein
MRRSMQIPIEILGTAFELRVEYGQSNRIMKTVIVQLPESVTGRHGESEEVLSRESQFLLALKLFELGRLSAKEAAAMCGINVVDFLLFAEKAVLPVETGTRVEAPAVGRTVTATLSLHESSPNSPGIAFDGGSLR